MEPKARRKKVATAAKKIRPAKSKLTLSVAPKYVAMLRRASARKGRSITELVEELAVDLEREQNGTEELSDYVKRNMGILAGKVKPEDWDRDDRVGYLLRKHVPR
jgi:hypothetical protein